MLPAWLDCPSTFLATVKLTRKSYRKRADNVAVKSQQSRPRRSLKDAELGARSSGLTFQSVTARSAKELDGASAVPRRAAPVRYSFFPTRCSISHVGQIAQASIQKPSTVDIRPQPFVDAGGLMSYGVNLPDLSRRAASTSIRFSRARNPRSNPRPTDQIRSRRQSKDRRTNRSDNSARGGSPRAG